MSDVAESEMFPRESGRFIADHAKHVSIDGAAVTKVAALIVADHTATSCGQKKAYADHPTHPSPDHPMLFDWVFLISTLNFSFWTDDALPKYCVTYAARTYTGYYALCAAIRRAVDECGSFVDPRHYSQLTLDGLSAALRSDTDTQIPLLEQRLEAVREAGRVLLDRFDGSFVNCVRACGGSALSLVRLIVREFASFRDGARYRNRSVSFYKRAQIAVADLSAYGDQVPLCRFDDLRALTMFADYRVPQVLHHLGVLRYSDELSRLLSAHTELAHGSSYEVEIRGCCIEAVEQLVGAVNAGLSAADWRISSATVDYFLWLYRRQHDHEIKSPYHRTRCIYY